MKKVIFVIFSLCLLVGLSLLAKESIERTRRRYLDEHENRVELVERWTGSNTLREKAEVSLPESEGSKKELSAGVIKDDLRKVDGIVKTDIKNRTMKLEKIQVYNPAFEMVEMENLKKETRDKILKEKKKLTTKEISKEESERRVEQIKNEFYLDFLQLKLENATVAGNQKEIDEVKTAIQKYKEYLNEDEPNKE
jgi:cell division protein FtsX